MQLELVQKQLRLATKAKRTLREAEMFRTLSGAEVRNIWQVIGASAPLSSRLFIISASISERS
jgi:hypothetical protein